MKRSRPIDPRRPHEQIRRDEDRPIVLEAGGAAVRDVARQLLDREARERELRHRAVEPNGDRAILLHRAAHVGEHVQQFQRLGGEFAADAERAQRHERTAQSCWISAQIASGSTMRPIAS